MKRNCLLIFTVIVGFVYANALEHEEITNPTDTCNVIDATIPLSTPEIEPDSSNIFGWLPDWAENYVNSLLRGNVDRTHEKAIDLSFGAIPSYTREASFGIGAMATGLYRIDRTDSIMQPSDVYASFNASLNGFFVLTFKGNNLFTDNRSRLSYKLEIYRKRLDFWGITAEETARNQKSKYDRRQIDLQAEYVYRITHNFFTGLQLHADYTDARNVLNPEYLLGERSQYYVTGLGLSFEYDTRDNLITPTKGIHLAYKPMIFPQFLGNAPSTFHSHTFIGNGYFRAWKGGIIALDLYAKINSSNTPWTMREMLASDGIRMRGYYMGSTIDNSQIAAQIELRQNIWQRFGIAVWGGAATIFSSIKDFKYHEHEPEWLHNFGIGLRYEFKHNVNVRVDYGFGQGTSGILFAIGEAF